LRVRITKLVLSDLFRPELNVRLRQFRPGVTVVVPKAPMHEYDRPMLWQNDVGSSWQIRSVQPKAKSEAMRCPSSKYLWRSVLAPHGGHVSRTLFAA